MIERLVTVSKLQVEQLDKVEELTGPAGRAGPEDEELAELMRKFYQAAVQVCALHLACVHWGARESSRGDDSRVSFA